MINRLRGIYVRYASRHRRARDGEAPAITEARLVLGFARDMARALPDILRWRRSGDPYWRARIKTRLALDPSGPVQPLDPWLFLNGEVPRLESGNRIVIILPVFNARDALFEALKRLDRFTDLAWHLVLVEDRSTDPEIRPFLRQWVAQRSDRVTLLENPRNLGFVGSVNRALDLVRDRAGHVVLLNSDAMVPQGWASRLLAPILADASVASVTPMSNDAEIFSVPVICTRAPLMDGVVDVIDHAAQRIDPARALAEAPTGVGFCMALNRAFLRKITHFDPAFGRGYGEEVDWCQKTRALGGRHVAAANLFVEHRGGESFGPVEKRALLDRNAAILSARYPDYDAEVQDYLEHDPLLSPRLALAVAFADSQAPAAVPIYLAHSLGGGAEAFLQDRIAADLSAGQPSIVLRVGGASRFRIEVITALGVTAGTTDDPWLLSALLEPLRARRIVYSCCVGDPDPVELPQLLLALRGTVRDEIEVHFHDYLPVSPSYCLLDADGLYRGPVTAERDDPAHVAHRPDGSDVPLAQWQAAWSTLLNAASRIVAFSDDSRAHVVAAFPELVARVSVEPHALRHPVPEIDPPRSRRRVVGILGNIGVQKGAGVLVELAARIGRGDDLSLVLIGNIDPDFTLPRRVPIHGDYDLADIPALAARYGVTCWLIPSIWPETFSYTTHEALATGLPVLAFDIGAQGQAVALAPNGHPVHFAPGTDLAQAILTGIEDIGRSDG